MSIEIYKGKDLYASFTIDYLSKTIEVITRPDRNIKLITSIFTYPDKGFVFEFKTVSVFLKNRGITSESEARVYENVDDDIRVVVSR